MTDQRLSELLTFLHVPTRQIPRVGGYSLRCAPGGGDRAALDAPGAGSQPPLGAHLVTRSGAHVCAVTGGNTKEFPIAELRGVQVTASRMLSSDEMIVTLSVPGRSRSIQARDFTGMDTASVGLVRRVENMVADTPHC